MSRCKLRLPPDIRIIEPDSLGSRSAAFTRVSITPPNPFVERVHLPRTKRQWGILSDRVRDWLTQTAHERSAQEWIWGVNLFWICYVGRHPLFPKSTPSEPSGSWSTWSADIIPVEGNYIRERFALLVYDKTPPAESSVARVELLKLCFKSRDRYIREGMVSLDEK